MFQNHFFFVTGVRVKFRSSTLDNCELTAWNFESNLQYCIQDNGEISVADELLRNGNLADAKWSSGKTKSRKENSRTALSQLDATSFPGSSLYLEVRERTLGTRLSWTVNTSYSPFTYVLSENVFCQVSVVLLNLVLNFTVWNALCL